MEEDGWTQLTAGVLPAEEAEWKVRVFKSPEGDEPENRMAVAADGRKVQFNFKVMVEFPVASVAGLTRSGEWIRTVDDGEPEVWRWCFQDQDGYHHHHHHHLSNLVRYMRARGLECGSDVSNFVQILYRLPMNDFVMK